MANTSKIPWEKGLVLICTKCGAKFNETVTLAEEVKTEIRKKQKEADTLTQIRVIPSGCLGVCYPEKQTIAYMPVEGKTELFTTELKKDVVLREVSDLLEKKISK